jgi:dihydrofolate reductase
MRVILIVAMTRDGLIGRDGRMPWHDSEDLRHFKRTTTGHAVIMGRKTYESIGKPLPGRRNIVLTRAAPPTSLTALDANTTLDYAASLEDALAICRDQSEEKVFVIGGAEVYRDALPRADELIVTWMPGEGLPGDTFFPAWNPAEWTEGVPHDAQFPRALCYTRRIG